MHANNDDSQITLPIATRAHLPVDERCAIGSWKTFVTFGQKAE